MGSEFSAHMAKKRAAIVLYIANFYFLLGDDDATFLPIMGRPTAVAKGSVSVAFIGIARLCTRYGTELVTGSGACAKKNYTNY